MAEPAHRNAGKQNSPGALPPRAGQGNRGEDQLCPGRCSSLSFGNSCCQSVTRARESGRRGRASAAAAVGPLFAAGGCAPLAFHLRPGFLLPALSGLPGQVCLSCWSPAPGHSPLLCVPVSRTRCPSSGLPGAHRPFRRRRAVLVSGVWELGSCPWTLEPCLLCVFTSHRPALHASPGVLSAIPFSLCFRSQPVPRSLPELTPGAPESACQAVMGAAMYRQRWKRSFCARVVGIELGGIELCQAQLPEQ